ncbi:hypothetical protein G6F65_015816 [Rhizopus arrhizus]|nr:hypothetical protein G6F65_015816 [Rhizopus arrhizus]
MARALHRMAPKGDEERGQDDAGHGVDDLPVVVLQPAAQPALRAEQQDEHQAGHHGRHRKRQVDQRDQELLAAELELRDGPGGGHAEHQVHRQGDRGHQQRQADRRQCVRLDDGGQVAARLPALQQVDDEQQRERQHQHHRGDGGGAGVVELLQLGNDQQRRDLGHHGHVAGDEHHRSVLAHRACEGQRKARHQRRQDGGQQHAADRLPTAGAQAGGGFLDLALDVFQHGLHGAHHERHADEDQGDHDAQRGERHFQVKPFGQWRPEPAFFGIQRGQRDARHGRGQRKRQVDQRVQDLLAGKAVAHQHPGHHRAEHQVHQRGQQRRAEARRS